MAKSATKAHAALQEGDRVRIVARTTSPDDRKANRYFPHMGGLTGTVQNMYEGNEVAVKIDGSSMTKATADVHTTATKRMREKFNAGVSEEQKKQLTKEELDFNVHYVLLVQSADLEPYSEEEVV